MIATSLHNYSKYFVRTGRIQASRFTKQNWTRRPCIDREDSDQRVNHSAVEMDVARDALTCNEYLTNTHINFLFAHTCWRHYSAWADVTRDYRESVWIIYRWKDVTVNCQYNLFSHSIGVSLCVKGLSHKSYLAYLLQRTQFRHKKCTDCWHFENKAYGELTEQWERKHLQEGNRATSNKITL